VAIVWCETGKGFAVLEGGDSGRREKDTVFPAVLKAETFVTGEKKGRKKSVAWPMKKLSPGGKSGKIAITRG